jgi:hypothetical protein
MENACENIRKFTKIGTETGATGFLNTDWGDEGHTNMLGVSFHGFAFGAEQAWSSGKVDETEFDRRFSLGFFKDRTGRMGKLYRLLAKASSVAGSHDDHTRSVIFDLYWDKFPGGDMLARGNLKMLAKSIILAKDVLGLATDLKTSYASEDPTPSELILAARQTIFSCQKGLLAHRVKGELKTNKRCTSKTKREVRSLAKEWGKLAQEFERLWLERNRTSEIHYNLQKYNERERDFIKLLY